MSKHATSKQTTRAAELLPPLGWGPVAIHSVQPGKLPEPGSWEFGLEGLVFEVDPGKVDVGPEDRVFGIGGLTDRPGFNFSGFYDSGRVISFKLTDTEENRSYTFFGVRSGNRLAGLVKPDDDNGEEEASWSAQARGGGNEGRGRGKAAAKKSRK
jgi:hypothetical protein